MKKSVLSFYWKLLLLLLLFSCNRQYNGIEIHLYETDYLFKSVVPTVSISKYSVFSVKRRYYMKIINNSFSEISFKDIEFSESYDNGIENKLSEPVLNTTTIGSLDTINFFLDSKLEIVDTSFHNKDTFFDCEKRMSNINSHIRLFCRYKKDLEINSSNQILNCE